MLREYVLCIFLLGLLPYQMSLVTNYIFKLMAVNLRESLSRKSGAKNQKTKLL